MANGWKLITPYLELNKLLSPAAEPKQYSLFCVVYFLKSYIYIFFWYVSRYCYSWESREARKNYERPCLNGWENIERC